MIVEERVYSCKLNKSIIDILKDRVRERIKQKDTCPYCEGPWEDLQNGTLKWDIIDSNTYQDGKKVYEFILAWKNDTNQFYGYGLNALNAAFYRLGTAMGIMLDDMYEDYNMGFIKYCHIQDSPYYDHVVCNLKFTFDE